MWRLDAAVDAVLAGEAQAAATAVRDAQDRMQRIETVTARLINFVHRDHPDARRLQSLGNAIIFAGDRESVALREAALAPWTAARAALLKDPDVPLPEIG